MIRPPAAFADQRFRSVVWVMIGAFGWLGLILLGLALVSQHPPRAGFDLNLILDAGRRVAAGASPYVAASVTAGTQAEDLFYSYPPPVAQAFAVISWLPNATALLLVGIGAVAGFAVISAAIGGAWGRPAERRALDVVLPVLAVTPFVYPFAIALLFGNADEWFPLVYGSLVVVLLWRQSRAWTLAAGVCLGLATIAKLHPGVLLVWLALRGLAERRTATGPGLGASWTVFLAALATIAISTVVSLALWGPGPWVDYAAVLRTGTSVGLASPLNIGPASQLAIMAGDPDLVRRLAPVGAVIAVGAAAAAALLVRSSIVSVSLAAVASLVVTPITWFHYPVAMMPIAVAAVTSAWGTAAGSRVAGLVIVALVVAGLAIMAPASVWLAVGLVLVAAALAPSRHVH